MPKLIESVMIENAKSRFRSFNLTLPTVVGSTPPSLGSFLVQSRSNTLLSSSTPQISLGSTLPGMKLGVGLPSRPTGTPQAVPPALFRSASNDKADTDAQAASSNEYANYIASLCHAIVGAHDAWRFAAHFQGVQIMGMNAIGGSITGPSLSTGIFTYGPQQGLWGYASAFTRAIADGLATCWHDWEQTVRIPGLPWYPKFAAYPSTDAPLTPNVPTPMNSLVWSPVPLSADNMKATIARKLSQPAPYSDELFTSIATAFATSLSMWFPTQIVSGVMGQGRTTFAPPYVPVGTVMNGSVVEASPHFAT